MTMPDKTLPTPGQQPPPPKMFNGVQGLFLVLILIAAVVGWVLYLNIWYQQPIDEAVETNTNTTAEVVEKIDGDYTYTAIEKKFVGDAIALPTPSLTSDTSIEEAMQNRRSARAFTDDALTQEQLGQMLWAGQGQTNEWGGKTAPSARGIYPYSFYVVVRNVTGITDGLYLYQADTHSIQPLIEKEGLLTGETEQASVIAAPAVLVYGAIYNKTLEKFQPLESAIKTTLLEAGHIGENIYLQAESIGLGTVVVGGFNPAGVKKELSLAEDETVVYLQPFGIEDTTVVEEE